MIGTTKKPKNCKVRNCRPIQHFPSGGESGDEGSTWCTGVRTGGIDRKRKALKNAPSDVVCVCALIGPHSEAHGQHLFIYNINDFYMEFISRLTALERLGLLERSLRTTFVMSDEVYKAMDRIMRNYNRDMAKEKYHTVKVGTRFIEYQCSCGEVFFRIWKKDYTPTANDLIFMRCHKKLGHTILYRKCKHVKHSKGKNPYWQEWSGKAKIKSGD